MGLITLLSDLGNNDASVAKVKAILMQHMPGMPIIDITHNIHPYYLPQAAYMLAGCINDFPEGSYHLVLFDLFYSKQPQLIYAAINGKHFLVPDNGILSLAAPQYAGETWLCFEQPVHGTLGTWVNTAAATIQKLQNAGSPQAAGLQQHSLLNAPLHSKPLIQGNMIECHVIHIDRFENVVLNITQAEFEAEAAGRSFSIQLLRDDTISEISSHYNAVKPGDKLCRFNSAGYLEIAINKGKAASLFGFRLMKEKQFMYNTIKITFL